MNKAPFPSQGCPSAQINLNSNMLGRLAISFLFLLYLVLSTEAIRIKNIYNTFFVPTQKNYKDALAHCWMMKARLMAPIVPKYQSELFYSDLVNRKVKHAWIAVNRRNDTSDDGPVHFMFEGYESSEIKYPLWAIGEPNNFQQHQERCVEIRIGSKSNETHNWNDRPCEDLNPFYCDYYNY